ncbi:MAG: mechanosensitive ion channel domain-containing protein [Pseudomonadota bacterium]
MWQGLKGFAQEQPDELVEEVVEEISETAQPVLELLQKLWDAIVTQVTSLDGAIEVAILFGTLPLAWLLAQGLKQVVNRLWPAKHAEVSVRIRDNCVRLLLPLAWLALLKIGVAAMQTLGYRTGILEVIDDLLIAWVFIQFVSGFVKDRFVARLFATAAWLAAALNILGLLSPTVEALDSATFAAGDTSISLWGVLKAFLLGVFLLWIANAVASLIKGSLSRSQRLTPSVQNLMAQGARIGLLFVAVMLALNTIGINLTAFAVFSGAIGVGIGFGLQSIFSNLMAGIILLLEKTVKVGDFVEFDNGLAGEVREINIRATLVTTNDNVDILVPNQEFINTRVTNWTLREGFRRIRIPFGVAYGTDKELVKKAALEAAESVPHNLDGLHARDPQVWLTGFGASSLDFELVMWIRPDSVKRPSRVKADYNWALETALTKYGIEIPFPQRDLHIRSGLSAQQFDNNGD